MGGIVILVFWTKKASLRVPHGAAQVVRGRAGSRIRESPLCPERARGAWAWGRGSGAGVAQGGRKSRHLHLAAQARNLGPFSIPFAHSPHNCFLTKNCPTPNVCLKPVGFSTIPTTTLAQAASIFRAAPQLGPEHRLLPLTTPFPLESGVSLLRTFSWLRRSYLLSTVPDAFLPF